MKLNVYSKKDTVLNIFENLVVLQDDEKTVKERVRRSVVLPEMKRRFLDSDYYQIGTFDDASGTFEAFPSPKFCFSLTEFIPLFDLTHPNEVTNHGTKEGN